MTDFTYSDSGMFVLIVPETPQAVKVWNEEIGPKTNGTGKILAVHWQNVRNQLEQAGYKVRKARKSNVDDKKLLDELFS
jgi:hypothetical protein